jgi:hypothetical protein
MLFWSYFAYNLVPHSLLLHKLSSFGFSDGYVSWLCSYLTNIQFWVWVSSTLSLPCEVIPSALQGSVLGPLLFNILTTYVTQLTTVNFHSSMMSKFSESLTNTMNASYFSLTLILWVTDALLTPRIWTLVWHNTYLTPGSLIFWITGISSLNLTCTSSIKDPGVFRDSIISPQSC